MLSQNMIPTCSVMFRRRLLGKPPEWILQLAMGDWPQWVLLAQSGDFGFINDTLGVYRIHSRGLWSSKDELTKAQDNLAAYLAFEKYIDGHSPIVRQNILDYEHYLTRRHLSLGNSQVARDHLGEYWKRASLRNARQVIGLVAQVCFPSAYLVYKRVRHTW